MNKGRVALLLAVTTALALSTAGCCHHPHGDRGCCCSKACGDQPACRDGGDPNKPCCGETPGSPPGPPPLQPK